MQAETVKRLLDLNRAFYSAFARDFSETRSSERTNIEPIIPHLLNDVKVLDVGCGNGRLAERLDREGYALDYVGIDATRGLLDIARTQAAAFRHVAARFILADLAEPGWADSLRQETFDLVLMLAVLHHVPGFDLRRQILSTLYSLIAPGGKLVLSNWQFDRNERLRNKVVPWSRVEIEEKELEPGDKLLDWKRGGMGYRYVHLVTEQEIQKLANGTGFEVERQFLADNNLNLFSILIASRPGARNSPAPRTSAQTQSTGETPRS